MIDDDDIDADANLYDFVSMLLEHRSLGQVRDLAWYLERFPDNDAGVAREYLALGQSAVDTPTRLFAGRYRILGELGRGGQGVVSLAHDTLLDRQVALKTIEAFGRRLGRLRREAEIAGALDHPAICGILEGDFEHNPPFVTMRFIEGVSLSVLIMSESTKPSGDRAPPHVPLRPQTADEVNRVLELSEKIAHALHVAHESGIVHRDVKPGNVMITPTGEPVLLDFGLASRDASTTPSITLTGEALGTPAYMSPEQVRGDALLDRTTDVYSLGVMLYECLTLMRPFDGPSRSSIERAILGGSPRKASSINRHMSTEIDAVLSVAIDPSSRQRYATADHFAEDLRRIRMREPILAVPPGGWKRTVRWVQRNPGISFALVTFMACLFVMSILFVTAEQRGEQRLVELLSREAIEHSSSYPGYAYAIAVEAHRRAPNAVSTNNALLRALVHHRDVVDLLTIDAIDWTKDALAGRGKIETGTEGSVIVYDTSTWEVSATIDVKGTPLALNLNPTGERFVVGSTEGKVSLWSVEPPALLAQCESSFASVLLVKCCWDSQLVFIGDTSGRLAAWSLEDGTVRELHRYAASVSPHARLSANHDYLVTFSQQVAGQPDSAPVDVWDARHAGRVVTLEGHTGFVRCAEFSFDARYLATGSQDRTARVWDLDKGVCIATMEHPGKVNQLAFDPTATTLGTCGDPGDLSIESGDSAFLWDWRDPESKRTALSHGGRRATYGIAFDEAGDFVVTANLDGHVLIWDAVTGTEVDRCLTAKNNNRVMWGKGRPEILIGTNRGDRVWRLEHRPPLQLLGHKGSVLHAAFSPDSLFAVTASSDGTAKVWNVLNGQCLETLVHQDAVHSAEFSRDGGAILTCCADGSARLWRDGAVSASFGLHSGRITHARFMGDARVVTASDRGELRLWSRDGTLLDVWAGHTGAIQQVRVAPDAESVASVGSDRSVRLWIAGEDGAHIVSEEWAEKPEHADHTNVFDVVFSADGTSLVTVGEDKHLRRISLVDGASRSLGARHTPGLLVELPDGTLIVSSKWIGSIYVWKGRDDALHPQGYEVHTSIITHLTSSPQGFVLTTSGDTEGMIHRVENAELIPHLRLIGHTDYLPHGDLSSDGTLAITACLDGTARVWPVHPADFGPEPRELTASEREQLGLEPSR